MAHQFRRLSWEALVPGQTTVHIGGGSETDWAFTPEGAVIAVMRNEAGDADGWGSKICRGEAHAIGDWTCMPDPKKYDSPLVFSHQNRIWLIARRNVTDSGAYDLEMRDLDHRDQTTAYSIDYWQHPKRCSLWEIDAESLRVTWVLDLPSKGDTCFASILPAGDHRYTVYNYSSDPQGEDLGWLKVKHSQHKSIDKIWFFRFKPLPSRSKTQCAEQPISNQTSFAPDSIEHEVFGFFPAGCP